jgi:hypothetical protein
VDESGMIGNPMGMHRRSETVTVQGLLCAPTLYSNNNSIL